MTLPGWASRDLPHGDGDSARRRSAHRHPSVPPGQSSIPTSARARNSTRRASLAPTSARGRSEGRLDLSWAGYLHFLWP